MQHRFQVSQEYVRAPCETIISAPAFGSQVTSLTHRASTLSSCTDFVEGGAVKIWSKPLIVCELCSSTICFFLMVSWAFNSRSCFSSRGNAGHTLQVRGPNAADPVTILKTFVACFVLHSLLLVDVLDGEERHLSSMTKRERLQNVSSPAPHFVFLLVVICQGVCQSTHWQPVFFFFASLDFGSQPQPSSATYSLSSTVLSHTPSPKLCPGCVGCIGEEVLAPVLLRGFEQQ